MYAAQPKVIPPPFRIHPVQCESNDSINIGCQGGFGPGGVDFAAGYIFYIIGKGYLYIGSSRVRAAEMDGDGIGDDNLTQYIRFRNGSFLPAHGLHGYRRFPHGNLRLERAALGFLHRYQSDGQEGCLSFKNRDIRNLKGMKAGCLSEDVVA